MLKRKTIPFKIETPQNKMFRNKPDQGGETSTLKNYNTLTKETEDDLNGKISYALIEELILLKGHTTQSHIQI